VAKYKAHCSLLRQEVKDQWDFGAVLKWPVCSPLKSACRMVYEKICQETGKKIRESAENSSRHFQSQRPTVTYKNKPVVVNL
jgi:hypothetical protein